MGSEILGWSEYHVYESSKDENSAEKINAISESSKNSNIYESSNQFSETCKDKMSAHKSAACTVELFESESDTKNIISNI